MSGRLKPILAVATLLALAGLIYWGLQPRPMLVDVVPVSVGPMAVSVVAEGRTRVIDRYEVSAPVTAQTRRITLEVGDAVGTGELLVTLDSVPPPFLDARSIAQVRAQVAAAESALAMAREEAEAARAQARFARDERRRLESLRADGYVSASHVEQAVAEADRAEAIQRSADFRVQTARFELEAARTSLDLLGPDQEASREIPLYAPVAGQVLARHLESARIVQPGEPILELGDPARLEVVVDVLSVDAVRIEPGMRVLLERWGGDAALEGSVRLVEPVAFTRISALGIDEQRVNVLVDIHSDRDIWQRLGHGFRLDARFILWETEATLRVPTSAVFRHEDAEAVFVADAGRARLRAINRGRQGGMTAQVLEGLEIGEQVITHPPRDLGDGTRIRIRERDVLP